MEKMRVAIYDEDTQYSQRLMNYLNGKYGEQIDATAFTKKEHFVREVADYEFDCVVSTAVDQIGSVPFVRICDEETEDGYYRYGSAKVLAQKLIDKANPKLQTMMITEKMIAIYDVSGSYDRTKYAIKKTKEVQGIYIGLEEFCSLQTEDFWMEELLFLIRERDEDICDQLAEHLQWMEGVKGLPSARCYLDYRYMEFEDYEWLIQKLSEDQNRPVIFDIGTASLSDFQIFSLFDYIFFLTHECEEKKRQESICLQLLSYEIPNIRDKIIFVPEEEYLL